MAACSFASACAFYGVVEKSITKRIKYASAFPYCKGSRHEECALYGYVSKGYQPPADTLPDGTHERYREDLATSASGGRTIYLVVEDSPVFAAIAANTLRAFVSSQGEVVQCSTYDEMQAHLATGRVRLIVCGYGLGQGKTAHDVRMISDVPIVILTGHLGDIQAPARSVVVEKSAGPERLRAAISQSLA